MTFSFVLTNVIYKDIIIHMWHNLYYLFAAGVVMGTGPCLVSCAVPLFGYTLANRRGIWDSFTGYALFSLGRLLGYAGMGALCGLFAEGIKILSGGPYFTAISIALSIFIIALGAATAFSSYDWAEPFCGRLHSGTARNLWVLGFFTGILPCLPLIGILDYVVMISRTWVDGILYVIIFGAGTVMSPLFILALLGGTLGEKFMKGKRAAAAVRVISGGMLIVFGMLRLIPILKGAY